MIPLDRTDRELLELLKINSRTTIVNLAKRIQLSRSATHDRIARLEEGGVIRRYTIEVDPSHASQIQALLLVGIEEGANAEEVSKELQSVAGLKRCHVLAGEIDVVGEATVAASNQLLKIRDQILALANVRTAQVRPILHTLEFQR